MEAAICTRCQSNNPLFTKFCLICGLEITAEMKREISTASDNGVTNLPLNKAKEKPEPAVAARTQNQPEAAPSPQRGATGWLKGLLGRS